MGGIFRALIGSALARELAATLLLSLTQRLVRRRRSEEALLPVSNPRSD